MRLIAVEIDAPRNRPILASSFGDGLSAVATKALTKIRHQNGARKSHFRLVTEPCLSRRKWRAAGHPALDLVDSDEAEELSFRANLKHATTI